MSLFDDAGFNTEIKKCNTCGDCRSRISPQRMCPMFRAKGHEAAAPRGMANALQAALEAPERLSADDIHAVAKNCIQCQQCRDECKAGIDIPHLMLEARAAHFAAHGYDRGDWLMTRSERLTALAGTFAFTANTLLSLKSTRWLMEKFFGLSRKRMIHRYTHRTYLRKRLVQRLFRRTPAGARKFAYFLDNFANYNDPLIAEATVAVLEHHGFAVTVPQRQRGSGMPALHAGDVATARARAAYNVRTLAELVRDDHTIVCSEPTAALALKIEYPRLLNSDDAKLVADHTVELTALLADFQSRGELKPALNAIDLSLGHHAPCHLKSLGPVTTPSLLSLIPKLRVHAIDAGCSGAAGAWGFTRANFDTSMAIGAPVFAAMDQPRVQFGVTECCDCRMQIQQGAGKRLLHTVQLLAYSYGLLPAFEARLTRPLKPRLTG